MRRITVFLAALACATGAMAQDKAPATIGDAVELPALKDLFYRPQTLNDLGEARLYVVYFIANTCPVAQRYMGAMNELHGEYAPKGVTFLGVNVSPADTILDTAQFAMDYGVPYPILKDMTGASAKALGITRTPEVAVLDNDRKLIYRGRVNDQFRLGGVRPKPTREDLRAALDEALAGKPISTPTTKSEGCAITYPPLPKPSDPVTFGEHIVPIVSKCAGCHKANGIAPFPLTTYEEVKSRADKIAEVVTEGRMPPWYAASEHGHFSNDTRLSEKEKLMVQQWVAGGALKGPDAELMVEAAIDPDTLLKPPGTVSGVANIGSSVRHCKGKELPDGNPIVSLGATGENIGGYAITATLPNGDEVPLLSVPAYDLEWPIHYRPAEPISLPEGATINITMHSPLDDQGKPTGRINVLIHTAAPGL